MEQGADKELSQVLPQETRNHRCQRVRPRQRCTPTPCEFSELLNDYIRAEEQQFFADNHNQRRRQLHAHERGGKMKPRRRFKSKTAKPADFSELSYMLMMDEKDFANILQKIAVKNKKTKKKHSKDYPESSSLKERLENIVAIYTQCDPRWFERLKKFEANKDTKTAKERKNEDNSERLRNKQQRAATKEEKVSQTKKNDKSRSPKPDAKGLALDQDSANDQSGTDSSATSTAVESRKKFDARQPGAKGLALDQDTANDGADSSATRTGKCRKKFCC